MTKPSFDLQSRSLFEIEEQVLKFWQDQKIFEKSLDKNPKERNFSFYDGPPFITGMPHYGTLLPSIAKDIIPRYQTMKGRYVRRIWGWDVHGLPAENQVEKLLGLKVKTDIEKFGIDKFVAECRKYVQSGSEAWKWYIDHIGRWVDLENAYRTDNLKYMESVIWVFKQLYDQDLIYRGRRTSLYCPRCATPLSKFEVTMDDDSYRDVEDPAVTVAFRLLNDEVYLLAWTTTPWTLPANLALAIDEQAEYVKVTDGKKHYILAHQALERFRDFDLEIVETFKGKKLIGEAYEPLYSFFPINKDLDYKIYGADFVSMEEGTGIVHVAPGFGEDDTRLGERVGLSLHETIDAEGHFVGEVGPWARLYYKKANQPITEDLKQREHLIHEERITHSYPHCYRCSTPLIYKAQVSWFMKIEPLRQELLKQNNHIYWVPAHFGSKRFAHNIENAPDWSLSRNRYWGAPLPVWETEDGEIFVPESVADLEKLSNKKITDLHRPNIDNVVLTLPSGKQAHRVPEVLDVWFESGSMPFAQDHYPFENTEDFERNFPTDFIIEYTGQLRGWFYYLHVLSNALKKQNSFKNVVVTGVMMGTDGRKMSKSYGNYPDPRQTIEKYGAESLRLYFMGSKIMLGEDPAISEEEIREQSRLLNVFHNALKYFLTYSQVHAQESKSEEQVTVLDRWITARLEEAILNYSQSLDKFDFQGSTKVIRPFIEDLSTWYIRRSRDRFVGGDAAALSTLRTVLYRSALAFAPTIPFTSEYFYQLLKGEKESVHLEDYPAADEDLLADEQETLELMTRIRSLASWVHMQRAESSIPLRQPLSRLTLAKFPALAKRHDLLEILRDEANVEVVDFGAENILDIQLTDELKREGRYRELVRKFQAARKTAGLQVGEQVALEYYTRDDEVEQIIREHVQELSKIGSFRSISAVVDRADLTKIDGEELAVTFKR